MLDEQSGERPSTLTGRADPGKPHEHPGDPSLVRGSMFGNERAASNVYADSGGASRFFYCAKASRRERGEGNDHPTVKPLSLMRHLVKLFAPVGGVVLDPFAGSGSTGVAALQEGRSFIGIERDAQNVEIARRRLG